MDASHRPILDRVRHVLAGLGGNVLDLGCGNAALLCGSLGLGLPAGVVPYGVDLDPLKCSATVPGILLPEFADHFAAENLFEATAPWPSRPLV